MIKVVFKLNKQNGYDCEEFTYANYEKAEVGDIVVVNTRYGYAIAKVTAVDVFDERFSESQLATVQCVVYSIAEAKAERAKREAYNSLIKKIRKTNMLNELKALGLNQDENNLIDSMNDDELKLFYNAIMK